MNTTTTTETTITNSSTPDAAIILKDGIPSLRGEVDDEKLMGLASKLVAKMSCDPGLALPGLDPLIGRRARALALCHAAFLSSFVPDLTEESVERAVRLADVFRRHHDSLAGCTWWSFESTRVNARAETLRYFDRAVSRAQLSDLAASHRAEISQLRVELCGAINGVRAPLEEAVTVVLEQHALLKAEMAARSAPVVQAATPVTQAAPTTPATPADPAATQATQAAATTPASPPVAPPVAPVDPVAAAEAAAKIAQAEFAAAKAKAEAASRAIGDARRAAKAQAAQAATQPAA